MQLEPVDAGNPIVLAPVIRRLIGAAHEQAVQHGQEHRPLQRHLVSPSLVGNPTTFIAIAAGAR
jgi:hypothetical protein